MLHRGRTWPGICSARLLHYMTDAPQFLPSWCGLVADLIEEELLSIDMATMSSRAMFVVVLSLALCSLQCANAATRVQIVGVFSMVTTMSHDLNVTVSQINELNGVTEGNKVAPGFQTIVNGVAKAASMLQNDPSRTELTLADAKLVVDALTTFVQVHQELLATVISKHGLLTMIPYTEPIREALVSLESTVDSFAFALIAFIPTSAQSDYTAQFGGLKVQVEKTIKVYSCSLGPLCASIGQ